MKKNYERPTVEKLNFQLTDDIANPTIEGKSVIEGGGFIPENAEGNYQLPTIEP